MKSVFSLVSLFLIFSSCTKQSANEDPCIDPQKVGKAHIMLCLYDPVCGCNGVTYYNYGSAEDAGLISWTEGPCPNVIAND